MSAVKQGLKAVSVALIDQKNARIIVSPNMDKSGFWYGGGNMIETSDGTIYLTGRFRNAGDSRTGLKAGERGLELAIFSSADNGVSFSRVASFSKSDLNTPGREVLSIEGTALNLYGDQIELFVSTEKEGIGYPDDISEYQKPGTGVWSIDRVAAELTGESSLETTLEGAISSGQLEPFLECSDPRFLHVKDPVVHTNANGATLVAFCTHPFNWTSANSGYTVRSAGSDTFGSAKYEFFPRGFTWDVAATRMTSILSLPTAVTGVEEALQIAFYDGAECLRLLDENPMAVKRPRGFSCEELGSAAWYSGDDIDSIKRLDVHAPIFLSPWGTACSRYVHTLSTQAGVFATWQQSQEDGSQPLVMHFLSWDEIRQAFHA